MKKLLLLLMVTGIVSTAVIAQEQTTPQTQKDPKQDRAEWEKKIKTELNLNADQTVKFDALSKEYNEKIETILKDNTLTKEVQKEKKMALKKEKEAKLFEFLTAEQQARYKALMEKKHESKPAGN